MSSTNATESSPAPVMESSGKRGSVMPEISPWSDEMLLPDQLHPIRSLQALSPEARLALAVLEDAVATLQATAGVETARA
jgi:hypothetical protein